MPKSKAGTAGQRSDAKGNRRSPNASRFEEVSKNSAQIVKDAAALLDEELAAGIQAAKQVQQRFRKEGRIDPADFSDALQRFQADAHEVIALLNDRLNEMRSQENFEVVQKLVERSHDLVDVAVELVNGSAEIANQLANSPRVKHTSESRAGRKR
jgi:hypothetical protein